MSLENLGGGPEKSQRVPPNPEGQTDSPNPEGEVNKGEGISRRDFLKGLLRLGAAAALPLGVVGAVGGCAELEARKYYENQVNEFLKGTIHIGHIEDDIGEIVNIYVDVGNYYSYSFEKVGKNMLEKGRLLYEVTRSLEVPISFLPSKLVRRIRCVVLKVVPENSQTLVRFESDSYVDIGIRLTIYYSNRFDVTSPEIQNAMSSIEVIGMLRKIFFIGVARLFVFGDDKFSRWSRENELDKCQDSIHLTAEGCTGLNDLINEQHLKEWLTISEQNGGYLKIRKRGYTTLRPFQTNIFGSPDLTECKNFGYINDPNIREGRLNFPQDMACVLGHMLWSLYRASFGGNPKRAIDDLLEKTPGETGLYRKYQIAGEGLMNLYEGSSFPYDLRQCILIIEDAIKEAEGTTNGQSSQPIQGAIKPEVTANSQSIQTNQGAIARQKTTNGQGEALKWLMEQKFSKNRES